MKGCELCNGVARMYCESDQASLCWDCDEKVHCANFLVAKHCRCLLCQICQSHTAWKASGPKLGPTVSICESCFSLNEKKTEITCDPEESHAGIHHSEDDCFDGDSDEDEDDDEDEDEGGGEEEEGENQVVPWSISLPTPPVASSSSSEDVSSGFYRGGAVLKRMRDNSGGDIDSDDEIGCSSYHIGFGRISNDEGNSAASDRPLKQARICEEQQNVEVDDDDGRQKHHREGQGGESRSTAIIHSLKSLQAQLVVNRENASQTILGICRLSRSHSSR